MLASIAALGYAPSLAPVATTSARTVSPSMDAATFKKFHAGFTPDTTLSKDWTSGEISDEEGLKVLAKKLNPIVGYWDPLEVGKKTKEEIAFFRQAEIKHGRVAMAAFVGYGVQTLGIHFPWNIQGGLIPGNAAISYADISAAGGPADQWDALSSSAKVQILLAVGFLEAMGEASAFLEMDGQQHYMRGGKPGYYPKLVGKMPHFAPLNLWDPIGFTKKLSAERKEQALLAEINNGRLAMIGIFGLISASEGLIVPGLDALPLPKYAGEVMAPFAANNADLPVVQWMLDLGLTF